MTPITICPACGEHYERDGQHDCPGPVVMFAGPESGDRKQ